jgi:hypothetical protein
MKESKSSQGTIRNRDVSLAERRAWTIPPDDLPADAVIDFGRRQDWEVQHPVTIDSKYNILTTGTWHDVNDKPW